MDCTWYDVGCQFTWMQEEVRLFFVWVLESILNGAVSVLAAIPVPGWAQNVGNLGSAIPSGVAYFASVFRVPFGAAMIGSAYGIRFIIRRLPFVG